MSDLFDYFCDNEGRLIFKWLHYFDIYERHFAPFRDREITFLEIGVFHGGSLQMWKNFFGPKAKIIGVDINPKCKEFEEEGITVEIGSQEDRDFLRELAEKHGPFDIVLDDGGHTMTQQIVTFEELYGKVKVDGLYLCEDLHTSYWPSFGGGYRHPYTFIEYAKRFIDDLHAWHSNDPASFRPTGITTSAFGLHFYDSMLVVEKRLITPPVTRSTGTASF
ncbi:MAG: class I SAM-dependent methyltransferase [Burkholderiales bacterium]|nr:class I SAM-dependent methyltransferase [Burkholderiales bacterium]